jgi:hypothetical protein
MTFRALNLQNTRRFAFFDRKNLPLPSAVVKDLVPTFTTTGSSSSGGGGGNDGPLDPKLLYPEESSSLNDGGGGGGQRNDIGAGEYFTLVAATNVSLPSSLSAPTSTTTTTAAATAGGTNTAEEVGAMKRGAGGDGAPAMQAGLFAMQQQSPSSQSADSSGALQTIHGNNNQSNNNNMTIRPEGESGGRSGGDGELQLLFASSRNTSLVHVIDVTVRCTPKNPHYDDGSNQENELSGLGGSNSSAFASKGSMDSNDPNNNNAPPAAAASSPSTKNTTTTANPEELDGWKGHYNPFLSANAFIQDTTSAAVDRNASSSSSSKGSSAGHTRSTSTASTSSISKDSSRRKSAKERILDEHLGGGKEFNAKNDGFESGASLFASSPFAKDVIESGSAGGAATAAAGGGAAGSSSVGGGAAANNNNKARIVSLATCSGPSKDNKESILYVASITDAPNTVGIVVHTNPHLMLSMISPSLLKSSSPLEDQQQQQQQSKSKMGMYSTYFKPTSGKFDQYSHGKPRCVSILPGVVCVGTDKGIVLVYVFNCDLDGSVQIGTDGYGKLSLVAEIPAPKGMDSTNEKSSSSGGASIHYSVSSLELIGRPPTSSSSSNDGSNNGTVHKLFVSYRRQRVQSTGGGTDAGVTSSGPSGGICCYELGGLRIPGKVVPVVGQTSNAPVVSSRYDLDGRDVGTSCLCDIISLPPEDWMSNYSAGDCDGAESNNNETGNDDSAVALSADSIEKMMPRFVVARGDGLHLYSPSEKVGVCPVDGNKIAACSLPSPPVVVYLRRPLRPRSGGGKDNSIRGAGASYALVATTDSKSGRDAVDIYDITNKLVGFHVLLSPGHRALRTVGIASSPTVNGGNLIRGGRSSAVVLTSGGSIVTLVEKTTPEKVDLLVQKNLYAAAISMAYADPQFYRPEDIIALYRRYAEHLYRKGDFSSSMDQYILTIGSLESSHVIFRFLDAPKIPLVVKYLEALRAQGLSSAVHDELLRTCYLKLNDPESAGKIIVRSSSSINGVSFPLNPDGTAAPSVPISRNIHASDDPSEMLSAICSLEAPEAAEALVTHGSLLARSLPRETAGVVIALCDGSYSPTALADAAAGRPSVTDSQRDDAYKYPISLFSNAFQENPKLLRLILSHCRRNNCALTPMLRRTLLELTLDEWSAAKRTGDSHIERTRHMEAMMMLSDHHDMGDYEALVIVQAAEFSDGEILLYEKLNMIPMLLEQYAASGTERARRQMLAMCERDPELCPEVLAHFVKMYGHRADKEPLAEDASVNSDSDVGGLLTDIHEALMLIRDHGELPPVRILRILSGETHGQFSADIKSQSANQGSVPLSAAIDYVGSVLDDSSNKIDRLQNKVEEYSRLCNEMELEINSLLSLETSTKKKVGPNVDIDDIYSRLLSLSEGPQAHNVIDSVERQEMKKEEFWREMEHSEDPFETICFFISKGYLENA